MVSVEMEEKKESGTAEGWQDRKWVGQSSGNFAKDNTCDTEASKKGPN